jgi:hypothetical protein
MPLAGPVGRAYAGAVMAETPRGGSRVEAAGRLRHDLGKYIRLSAPSSLETDTEALRARLRSDVLATRSGTAGTETAPQVFEAWMREDGALLAGEASLDRIRRAIEEVRVLASRLEGLARPELEGLDALTQTIARETRRLVDAARRSPS